MNGTAAVETERVPAGSNWAGTMSAVFYYGVPALYIIVAVSMVLYGSGWFQTAVDYTGYLAGFVIHEPAGDLTMRAVASFALLSVFFSALRVSAAIKIPPEATLGQSIDRVIAVVPVIVILVMVTWAKAKGWEYDPVSWKCLVIAFWTVLLLDFWIAGLVQKQIAAFRRRLDVV